MQMIVFNIFIAPFFSDILGKKNEKPKNLKSTEITSLFYRLRKEI